MDLSSAKDTRFLGTPMQPALTTTLPATTQETQVLADLYSCIATNPDKILSL